MKFDNTGFDDAGGHNVGRIRKNALKKDTKKISAPWLVLVFIFICELFIYTGIRVDCTRNRFQISQAEQLEKKSQAYQKELIIELERLGSPERIARIARTRLALDMPEQNQVVYMDK